MNTLSFADSCPSLFFMRTHTHFVLIKCQAMSILILSPIIHCPASKAAFFLSANGVFTDYLYSYRPY